MYRNLLALVAAVTFILPSPAFASWNTSPETASQLRVEVISVEQNGATAAGGYRVFVKFDRSAYPHGTTVCGHQSASAWWRVYGNGDAQGIKEMTNTLLAAHLSNRRVAILMASGGPLCVEGYAAVKGVMLLGTD